MDDDLKLLLTSKISGLFNLRPFLTEYLVDPLQYELILRKILAELKVTVTDATYAFCPIFTFRLAQGNLHKQTYYMIVNKTINKELHPLFELALERIPVTLVGKKYYQLVYIEETFRKQSFSNLML